MNSACLREDKKRGLAVVLRGEGIAPLCLARAVYDGKLRCWKPDYQLGLQLSDFASWPTRAEAVKRAKDLRWKRNMVTHLGTRFSRGYGLRWDLRYPYFLAVCWSDEKINSVICAHMSEGKKQPPDLTAGEFNRREC
jgi:hypothetical protein